MAPLEVWQHSRMVPGHRAPTFHCESVRVAWVRSSVCLTSRRLCWGRPSLGSYYDFLRCNWRLVYGEQAQKGLSNISHEPHSSTGTQWSRSESRFGACSETNIVNNNVAQNHIHACSQTWTKVPYLRTHGICRCHCGISDGRFQLVDLAHLPSVLAEPATVADTRATCSARTAKRCAWKSFRLVGQPVPSHNHEVVRKVWWCL